MVQSNVTSSSSTTSNGILVDAGLVNLLLERAPKNPGSLVRWNGTEAITSVLNWYWHQVSWKDIPPERIPYYPGTGTDTFSYRNAKVRATLEANRNIANLGWFINEAIAASLGHQHTPVFARVAKVSEWTKLLELTTKTIRIATPPTDDNSGDDSDLE